MHGGSSGVKNSQVVFRDIKGKRQANITELTTPVNEDGIKDAACQILASFQMGADIEEFNFLHRPPYYWG